MAYKRRSLENFDTDVFVTSTIYFPKEELEKFVKTLTSVEIIDERLASYVEILKELLKSKSFDNLPKNPAQRKKVIIDLVSTKIDLIPNAIHRDKVKS